MLNIKWKDKPSNQKALRDLRAGDVFTFPNQNNVYMVVQPTGVLNNSKLLYSLKNSGQVLVALLAAGRVYSVDGQRDIVLLDVESKVSIKKV
jgi:hypothetical protein